jgi:hypothetical protein
MKEFLFLFRGGAPAPNTSPQELQEEMKKWGAWIDGLTKAGKFKAGLPLEQGGKIVSGRNKLVTDGPFPESKEVVGGYLIVTAQDLNEAAEIAKGCPIFEHGGAVEVRTLQPMTM